MKKSIFLVLLLLAIILTGCYAPIDSNLNDGNLQAVPTLAAQIIPSASSSPQDENNQSSISTEIIQTNTPGPTPTPDIFAELYGCEMDIQFNSGPLEGNSSQFLVLTRDYFLDKGDKFAPGKGTAVYYEEHHYFILHSSFYNGNMLRPMEAEFLRKHLEYWGTADNEYIERQINSLLGSEVIWACNGEDIFKTSIDSVVRLSHESSDRLWLEPRQLDKILEERGGEPEQWVGNVDYTDPSGIYIGFCGWGPENLGENRFTYYRYLIHFEVIP